MAEVELKDRKIVDQLQLILNQSVASGVPGISAAIHGSETTQWSLAAGFADVLTQSPISKSNAFGVGSITKVFVAVVVLQLIQEKKVSIDDRAVSILGSEDLDGIQHAKEATIGHLLSHTGGISSWEDDQEWQQDGRGRNVQPSRIWKKRETLQYVRRSGENGLKVGDFHYANTNYTILGLVIERVTQNTTEAEIRRRILQPLDMTDTYFEGFEQPEFDQTPHRYHWATETFRNMPGISPSFTPVRQDLVDVTGTNLSVSWTAGGMISTPTDLLKFASALQSGALLTPASIEMLLDWKRVDERMDMGHGIFRLNDHSFPGTWVGHNGGVLGFTAALWWSVDSACVVAILSNVGASHAGQVPSSAARVALSTDFLKLAAQL